MQVFYKMVELLVNKYNRGHSDDAESTLPSAQMMSELQQHQTLNLEGVHMQFSMWMVPHPPHQ